ncbi:ligase-associated DNA damage response endonuclease PdeM [Nereida sp. MMG025]|uniref:ligase-associated DNA damage response endonuclease PdeM n=1 Tax=Nereida sp. MMG025 TaxID=2909981 RepID=UPI001F42615A|nr:ligase-associated DNA damage response endonuclease PdeM [Nereida sp. MMG025]MCF6444990.1 ligase-associated DNA damage response endonuclease PdeM [Nereida sp. MMG025]
MNERVIHLNGAELHARGDGALFWPAQSVVVVSDLHLGKSERIARRSGQMVPPYETEETLGKLDAAIEAVDPKTVICLGDSFDDLIAAQSLSEAHRLWIARMQAGREWIWIEGNHDAGPTDFGGTHLADLTLGALHFTHITSGQVGEISGHYHPKATMHLRGRAISRPCFLYDTAKLIMPAFGAYTGGLRTTDAALVRLMDDDARAVLTGQTPCTIPMPR